MIRYSLATVVALVLCTVNTASAAVSVEFDADGLRSIKLGDREQLLQGAVSPTNVRSDDGKMLRGKPDASAFDPKTLTRTSTHAWGRVTTQYEVLTDGVRLRTTVANTSDAPLKEFVVALATIRGESDTLKVTPPASTVTGPGLVTASGKEAVIAATLDAGTKPAGIDFVRQADAKTGTTNLVLRVMLGGDRVIVDNVLATRPIAPGGSDSFVATVRFAGPDVDPLSLVKEEIDAYRAARPATIKWPDRRPVLRLFFGGGLPANQANENLKNPDQVKPPEPDLKFKEQLLKRIRSTIVAAKEVDAQAVIIWDPEGGSFPHPVTYIGDPRHIRLLNPQMDLVIDEAMKMLTDAGIHAGVTLRPSRVTYWPDKGTAAHSHTVAEDPFRELDEKIEYAKKRWGCRIFYIDTNFFWRPYGAEKKWQSGQLTAELWQRLQSKYPDTLFVPEFGTVADFQSTAPYGEADMGDFSTPALVRAIWPDAFRVIVVEDADPYEHFDRFVAAVRGRNALMTYGFSPESANVIAIKRIYTEAKLLDQPVPAAIARADAGQLVRMLDSGEMPDRFYAARQLAIVEPGRHIDALLRVANDAAQEWVVRHAALAAVAKAPTDQAIPDLLKLLRARNSGLYSAAGNALANLGQPAVAPLVKELTDIAISQSPDPWAIEQIGGALKTLKATAEAAKIRAIVDSVPEGKSKIASQKAVLFVLARLNSPDQAEYFTSLLQHESLYEPAALGLVLGQSKAGTDAVRAALEAAKSANQTQKVAVLTRVLRAK